MAVRLSYYLEGNDDLIHDILDSVSAPDGWEKSNCGITVYASNLYEPEEAFYSFVETIGKFLDEHDLDDSLEIVFCYAGDNITKYVIDRNECVTVGFWDREWPEYPEDCMDYTMVYMPLMVPEHRIHSFVI